MMRALPSDSAAICCLKRAAESERAIWVGVLAASNIALPYADEGTASISLSVSAGCWRAKTGWLGCNISYGGCITACIAARLRFESDSKGDSPKAGVRLAGSKSIQEGL